MSLEDKVQAAGDALVRRIEQYSEREIRAFVSELLTDAARERADAIAESRRGAEEAQEQAVRVAGARVRAEVERTWAEKLRDANESAEHRYADALRTARQETDRQMTEKVAAVRAEGQRVLEAALEAARQEADRHLTERVREVRAQAERTLARELEAAQARAELERPPQPAEPGVAASDAAVRLERVAHGIRRLDQAASLTAALDALGELAAAEAPRTVLLTVQNGRVRGWGGAGLGETGDIDLALGEAGIVGRAVVTRTPRSVEAGAGNGSGDAAPAFASLADGTQATAVPLLVGGQVMAVLYGDDTGDTAAPGWQVSLEILARHASHCLEALTAARAAQLAMHDLETLVPAVPQVPGPTLPFNDAGSGKRL